MFRKRKKRVIRGKKEKYIDVDIRKSVSNSKTQVQRQQPGVSNYTVRSNHSQQ
jgi:hypothetical protein